VIVRPARHQVDDLVAEIHAGDAVERPGDHAHEEKMAEDLTDYLQEIGIRVRYIHADIDTISAARSSRLPQGQLRRAGRISLLREARPCQCRWSRFSTPTRRLPAIGRRSSDHRPRGGTSAGRC
jgi:hypothetical protein